MSETLIPDYYIPDKFIFLDIDGVLNSMRTVIAFPKQMRDDTNLDPIALGIVKRLVEETKAVICLSSTWRKFHSLEEIRQIFRDHGYGNAPVLYQTPISDSGFRGEEIAQFLDKYEADHEIRVKSYVIFDDDSDFYTPNKELPLKIRNLLESGVSMRHRAHQPFVQTSDSFGLTTACFFAARYILNTLPDHPNGDKHLKRDIMRFWGDEKHAFGEYKKYIPVLPPEEVKKLDDVKLRY